MDKKLIRKLELANKKLSNILVNNNLKNDVQKSIVFVIESIDSVLEESKENS